MVDPTRAMILQSASYVFEKEAEEGKANSLEWNLGSSGTKPCIITQRSFRALGLGGPPWDYLDPLQSSPKLGYSQLAEVSLRAGLQQSEMTMICPQ
ncbi:predicted protein [Histoplasma capsulatum var. duboisii H88]|uniref:Predicted protein n=1 Tax=Ajellomyces capsulatus (strain H88) TaxID=544711 RepID=F0UJG3_AJEC8|nr:predicted protein [Histoplasma capsulatum var. duboisii H88]